MPKIDLILSPVDFSPGSERAAEYAMWLAGRLGARLRLLHVVGGLSHVAGSAAPGAWAELAAAEREVREQADRDLADLAARLVERRGGREGPEPETAVLTTAEPVADAILNAARAAGADLVVMSTHGRSGVRRMILGSVAEQVVRSADCPVLTLK